MPEDLWGYTVAPEFGRQTLADIAALNRRFIDLLTAIYSQEGELHDRVLEMRTEQVAELTQLSRAARDRLTRCAVTLFALHLEDQAFWLGIARGVQARQYTTTVVENEALRTDLQLFTLGALMYLRHLASVNPFLASLSFSVSVRALERFAALPIARLQEVAHHHPALLSSRLGQSQVWDGLVRLARRNDALPMVPSRLLGFQHALRDD